MSFPALEGQACFSWAFPYGFSKWFILVHEYFPVDTFTASGTSGFPLYSLVMVRRYYTCSFRHRCLERQLKAGCRGLYSELVLLKKGLQNWQSEITLSFDPHKVYLSQSFRIVYLIFLIMGSFRAPYLNMLPPPTLMTLFSKDSSVIPAQAGIYQSFPSPSCWGQTSAGVTN